MTRTRDMMLTEPGALLRRMFCDLDPWFEPRGLLPVALRKTFAELPWMPSLEMIERDHTLVIKLDLPGLKKEEVNVSFTDEGLVVEGERMHEVECKKNEWFTTERTYGHFYRLVPLPEGVNYKEVKATFKNGVLEVMVPVPAAVAKTPYKVPIEGEAEVKDVKVAAA
jgi:HSP20 family protein